jgi:hypothetical protein
MVKSGDLNDSDMDEVSSPSLSPASFSSTAASVALTTVAKVSARASSFLAGSRSRPW